MITHHAVSEGNILMQLDNLYRHWLHTKEVTSCRTPCSTRNVQVSPHFALHLTRCTVMISYSLPSSNEIYDGKPLVRKFALWHLSLSERCSHFPTRSVQCTFVKPSFHSLDLGLFLHFHYRRFFGHTPTLAKINAFQRMPYSKRFE